jgi:hypothetical protein
LRKLFALQGAFYFFTGVWPLVDIVSFMVVTGPKTDLWLVKTVGVLVTASGIGFLRESRNPAPSGTVALIAALEAIFLTFIDVYYVSAEVIRPIYLADAAVEIVIFTCWLWVWRQHKR